MSADYSGNEFAREAIRRIFLEMHENYIEQNREIGNGDSFVPFLINMGTGEPRIVASALAFSRLPLFHGNVRKVLREAYDDVYQQGFYGSANEWFDCEATQDRMPLRERFCEFGAAGSAEKRRELYRLAPPVFREIDEWTKGGMNGGTLGGTYGRHCLTARFEDCGLTLAYNPDSQDECGSLAKTRREDDIVIFDKTYLIELPGWPIGVGDVMSGLKHDFSGALRERLELPEKSVSMKFRA